MFLKMHVKGRSFIFYEKLFFIITACHTPLNTQLCLIYSFFLLIMIYYCISFFIFTEIPLYPLHIWSCLFFNWSKFALKNWTLKSQKSQVTFEIFWKFRTQLGKGLLEQTLCRKFITFVYLKMLILTIFTFCLRKEAYKCEELIWTILTTKKKIKIITNFGLSILKSSSNCLTFI